MKLDEVKPALRFLGIFLGGYFILNLIYGIWIESLGKTPDAMTYEVSAEVAAILNAIGYTATIQESPSRPVVILFNGNNRILNVFEGCNGINVMIVFLSFVMAFGGARTRMLWFLGVGFVVIHLANLGRILWLFWLANNHKQLFYYFHKYLFTAMIYLIVFALWWMWVTKLNGTTSTTRATS